MTTFVKKYIMGCDMCQQIKNHIQQPFEPLISNKVPNGPQEIISMDLIIQLPESNSYDAIYIIVDKLIKRVHFIPINNWFSSKDMAQLLYAISSFLYQQVSTVLQIHYLWTEIYISTTNLDIEPERMGGREDSRFMTKTQKKQISC